MRRWLWWLALLTACLLSACQYGTRLSLLQIDRAALGPDRSAQQRLTLALADKSHVLENMLEIDESGLHVVGLAMGVRVYSFDYDGRQLIAGPGHLPPGLSEQQIANDLLLVFAPPDALQTALPPGWKIEEMPGTDLRIRKLLQNQQEIARIQYHAGAPWQGRTTLTWLHNGYQLILDSASEP